MADPETPAQEPMSVQPSKHDSTTPTQSLPKLPGANPETMAMPQKRTRPDEQAIRMAQVREKTRLDALEKQREALKRRCEEKSNEGS